MKICMHSTLSLIPWLSIQFVNESFTSFRDYCIWTRRNKYVSLSWIWILMYWTSILHQKNPGANNKCFPLPLRKLVITLTFWWIYNHTSNIFFKVAEFYRIRFKTCLISRTRPRKQPLPWLTYLSSSRKL